ncbi:hypothetical protein WKW77_33935 [Variovorax ureilyticus]|uniref:Uncharacterized protein n=1 Tax=Variovorax ureilyticus TaxID=1836198 RepID=A0ABU8VT30_9BURK
MVALIGSNGAGSRAVDARALQLNWFVVNIVDDPFGDARKNADLMRTKFELAPGLANLSGALRQRISTFQLVRQFAQKTGALAYLLRSYQKQLKERTFMSFDSHVARFVIAAIGGGVVGLFTNFTSGGGAGVSISPLAIAFLVGYATDVFFSFLDSFVHTYVQSHQRALGRSWTRRRLQT